MHRRLHLVLLTLGLALLASRALADTYIWTDESGTAHMTDQLEKVPPEYRENVNFVKDAGGGSSSSKRRERARPAAGKSAAPGKSISFKDAFLQFGVGSLLGLLFAALLIKRACRMCSQDEPSFLKAIGVALLSQVLGSVAFYLLAHFLVADGLDAVLAAQGGLTHLVGGFMLLIGLGFASMCLINVVLFRILLCESWIAALLVQLMYLVVLILLGLLLGAVGMCIGVCVS